MSKIHLITDNKHRQNTTDYNRGYLDGLKRAMAEIARWIKIEERKDDNA